MSGPKPDGTRFHAAYYNGNGPENNTITMDTASAAFVPGSCHVWVHNFAGDAFDASVATLTLTGASQLLQIRNSDVTTRSPNQRTWRGFEFTVDPAGALSGITELQRCENNDESSIL